MSPRISADEAVEWLKIHQLRKENKTLHQEVQALREEVKACCRVQTQVREHLDGLQQNSGNDNSVLIEHLTQLSTREISLQQILERLTACETTGLELKQMLEEHPVAFSNTLENLGHDVDRVFAKIDYVENSLDEQVQYLEVEVGKLRRDVDDSGEGICRDQVASMRRKLNKMVVQVARLTNARAEVVEDGPSELETETVLVPATSSQYFSSPSLSAVQTPETSLRDDLEDVVRKDAMLLDLDYGGTIPNASGICPLLRGKLDAGVSSVVEQLDMQDAASLQVTDVHKAISSLQTKLDVLLEVAQLRQHESETVSAYLGRMKSRTSKLPQDTQSARIYLKRFLAGLGEEQNRIIVQKWLETSQWSLEEAEECAMLLDAVIKNRGSGNPIRPEVDLSASEPRKTQGEDPAIPALPDSQMMPTNKEVCMRDRDVNDNNISGGAAHDNDEQEQPKELILTVGKCKTVIELEQPEPCKRAPTLRGGDSPPKNVR